MVFRTRFYNFYKRPNAQLFDIYILTIYILAFSSKNRSGPTNNKNLNYTILEKLKNKFPNVQF